MLALSLTFVSTLLLSLQQNSLALPTAITKPADTEHYRKTIVIEGQDPPPCLHDICPLLSVVAPQGLPNSVSNATILQSKTDNITNVVDATPPGEHIDGDSNALTNCSSSAENKVEPDTETSHYRSAKPESMRAAYRIVGQPPPPCHNHICPLTQSRRSEVVEEEEGSKKPAFEEANHTRSAFVIIGANQTVPPSCLNGKVRCLFESNGTELGAKKPAAEGANHPRSAFVIIGANQTVPPSCLNGKVRCLFESNGTELGAKKPAAEEANHPRSAFVIIGANQTVPPSCLNGKVRCLFKSNGTELGAKKPAVEEAKHPRSAFVIIGANHTVPPSCLNGKVRCLFESNGTELGAKKPAVEEANHPRSAFVIIGANHTVPPSCLNGKVRCLFKSNGTELQPHQDSYKKQESSSVNSTCRTNRTSLHLPTKQTAPITCGDGTKPPCGNDQSTQYGKHHPIDETALHFPITHQTAPIHCGDGTKPPCGKNHSTEGTTPRFPGTKQTAPINCGDGTKPPCGKNHSAEGTTPSFPGTKQTAPITCGDGTKPPCHTS